MGLYPWICSTVRSALLGALLACPAWWCAPGVFAHGSPLKRMGQHVRNPAQTPLDWEKHDAGAFFIFTPSGWRFHHLEGADSFVGEFVGDGIVLKFDFGEYSNPLKMEKGPGYDISHELIGGCHAKMVRSKKPGRGLTGVYFRRTFGSNKLTMFGQDLTAEQQDLAIRIFETIRFGRNVPPVIPPPARNVRRIARCKITICQAECLLPCPSADGSTITSSRLSARGATL